MKKRTILLILTAVAVLAITGFVFADSFLPRGNDQSVSEEDSKNYEYYVEGDELIVELAENPSTGYTWVYTVKEEAALELVSDDFVSEETDMLGAPGTRKLVFRVNAEGKNEIVLSYIRSFGSEDAEDTVIFELDRGEGTTLINVR